MNTVSFRLFAKQLVLLLLGVQIVSAQIYNYQGVSSSWQLRLYVPEDVTDADLKGVIIFQNGSGEHRDYMTQYPWVQAFCRVNKVAALGYTGPSSSNLAVQNNSATTAARVDDALTKGATISGRASLRNAPILVTGMSFGALQSSVMGAQLPSRVLGWTSVRGIYQPGTINNGNTAAAAEPIAAALPGEIDGNSLTHPGGGNTAFLGFRALASNTGRIAFATDWQSGHDPDVNVSWDFTMNLFNEALRLRHPGGALSTAANTFPALVSVPFNNGFLVERASFSGATTVVDRPTFPRIYPAASYSGSTPATGSTASWLPTMSAALAYQGITSTDNPGRMQIGHPKNNALQIETPTRFQILTTADSTEISVNTRDWRTVSTMSFYLDGTLLGTKTDGDWRWPLASLTKGFHTIVVTASDPDGNQRAMLSNFSVLDVPSSGNTWTGAAGNSFSASGNWSLGTASWTTRMISAAWETKVEVKQPLFFDGAAANGQYSLNTSAFSNTPALFGGLHFKSAPGANGFTITAGNSLYLGDGGIRNLDDSLQTVIPGGGEGLCVIRSQTWAAVNGDLLINAPSSKIVLGNSSNDPWSNSWADLTLFSGSGRTITVNTPLKALGGLVKDGPGLAVLQGVHNFADSFYYWQPIVAPTIRVMQGTLRMGTNCDFLQGSGDYNNPNYTTNTRTARLFIADRSDAVFDVAGRPLSISALSGGGNLTLGSGGTLNLKNQYEFGAVKDAVGTNYRGSITGGTSGQTTITHTAARTWSVLDGSNPPAALDLDLTLAGNSSFLGRIALVGGKLNVGHSNALGATGAGNETIVPVGSSVQLIGAAMNIPEDFTFNTAVDAVALSNASAKFSNTSGADVTPPTPAAGSNTVSGLLRFPTVISSAPDHSALVVNESPNTTLTLSGTLTGQDWSSGGTGKTRLILSASGAGANVAVPGVIANGGNGVLALVLRKTGAAAPVFTIGEANTYSGGTTVEGGTLLANNSAGSATGSGPVTVASGALLGGTGRIAGAVTIQANGSLVVDMGAAAGAHDPLDLEGSVTFAASSILTVKSVGSAPGTYPLLTAAGGINGPLPTLVLPPNWGATLQLAGNTLNLVVTSTDAPNAPSNPGIVVNSSTQLTVVWTDNSVNETGFKIERSASGTSGWTQIGVAAANATSYANSGLAPGSIYYYRVRSFNANGDSSPSSVVSNAPAPSLQLIEEPFGDASGTPASSLALRSGISGYSGAGAVQAASALSYPAVISSGNGFATGNGRYFMNLDTSLPGLAPYVSGGRIGGIGSGVLYVSWLARGINAQEANSVEFRTGSADNEITVSIGTTFGSGVIRAMSANALNGGIVNYNNSSRPPSAGTDLYVAKFTFGQGNATRVDVFVNQTTEGTPDVTTTGFAQFNGMSFAKYGGAAAPSVDEFRVAATYAAAVPLQPANPAPALGGITPASGPAAGGTTVTISGSNFSGATAVAIGGVPASSFAVVNASQIIAVTPPGSVGTFHVSVTNPGGTGILPDAFTYESATPLQAFRIANGLAADGSQDLLVPAGDGVANLLKYAFNMLGSGAGQGPTLGTPNSTVMTANGAAGLPLLGITGGGKLTMTYVRRKASTNPGVTYAVEFSDTLASGSWAENPSASVQISSIDPTFERVTVTDSVTPSKRFARVRVSIP